MSEPQSAPRTGAPVSTNPIGRSMAALNQFFDWWGEHRGWPANEPAQIRARYTTRPRRDAR